MTDGIFLLLGSNLGDQVLQLAIARRRLTRRGVRIRRVSNIYRSAAWGPVKQGDFANQVLQVEFDEEPVILLNLLLAVEQEMGRSRNEKWGPRIIDIDLLYFNQQIIEMPGLSVPHPEIAGRRFTLAPLSELAPEFEHPLLKKDQALLLKQCPDNLEVSLWV